ncbi:MAG: hypothetical protein WA618_01980 [Terriglobales bacterium]
MAAELIGTNYAMTTVGSGGYTSGASALDVVSTSTGTGLSPFPAAGNFRVTIFNQSTGAPEVVLLVTAIASGTQFTTTAEVDGNASAGDLVLCTITSGGVGALLAQANMTGTFASLPTTVPFAGARYKCTDAPYEFISNGSAWKAFYNGFPASLPPSSGWTAENCLSPFPTFTNGNAVIIGATSSNSDFLSMAYATAPGSTPYSFTARVHQDPSGIIESLARGGSVANLNQGGFAIGFRDSGGKYTVLMLGGLGTIFITEWNSYSSVNGNQVSSTASVSIVPLMGWGGLWFRVRNDGTNLKFYLSLDGQTFYQLYSQTITAFLSNADNVAFGMYGHTESSAICLYDWTQGT